MEGLISSSSSAGRKITLNLPHNIPGFGFVLFSRASYLVWKGLVDLTGSLFLNRNIILLILYKISTFLNIGGFNGNEG